MLSTGSNILEDMKISSTRDPTNAVSRLLVEVAISSYLAKTLLIHACIFAINTQIICLLNTIQTPATEKAAKLYLQESFTDSVAMYVVYAPMDVAAAQYLSDGKDADSVPILPCGFAILPDKLCGEGGSSGSILTISFQLIDEKLSSPHYLPPTSVRTIYKIIRETVSLIKAGLLCN